MFRTISSPSRTTPALVALFAFALAPLAATFAATIHKDGSQPAMTQPNDDVYGDATSGYLRAQRGVLAGDSGMALDGFLTALAQDSGNLGLQQDAFAAALLTGDVDTAVRLARVLPAAPDSETMVWLVKLADAAKHGDSKTALTIARRLEHAVPELLQFKLMRAYAERENGLATETVIRQMGPVDGIAAQQAREWYHIGRMRAQTGDVHGAINALQQAYVLEPNSLFTVSLLTRLYRQSGQAVQADELLAQFEASNPQMGLLGMTGNSTAPDALNDTFANDMGEVMFDFGILVWAQGAELTARQIFNLALWLSPDAAYALYYSAMMEEHAGDYARAEDRYTRLLANPEVGDAVRLRLAELHFKEGNQATAVKQVEAILQAHPQDLGALRARAEMAFDAMDYEVAAKRYREILKLMPAETDAQTLAGLWFALGAAEERNGRLDKAEEALKASLGYEPTNPGVLNYLGYMWVEHGVHLDEAFLMLNSALMLAPQDGAIMDSVGWAFFLRGDTAQALMFLEQAAELAPDDPVVVDHLGDAYLKQGRTLEAVWHWRRALVLAKDSPEDQRALVHEAERKIRKTSD